MPVLLSIQQGVMDLPRHPRGIRNKSLVSTACLSLSQFAMLQGRKKNCPLREFCIWLANLVSWYSPYKIQKFCSSILLSRGRIHIAEEMPIYSYQDDGKSTINSLCLCYVPFCLKKGKRRFLFVDSYTPLICCTLFVKAYTVLALSSSVSNMAITAGTVYCSTLTMK